jgi:hypothetical protein
MNNLARFAFNWFRIIILKNVVSYEIYKGKKSCEYFVHCLNVPKKDRRGHDHMVVGIINT